MTLARRSLMMPGGDGAELLRGVQAVDVGVERVVEEVGAARGEAERHERDERLKEVRRARRAPRPRPEPRTRARSCSTASAARCGRSARQIAGIRLGHLS